ncbi:MAG: M1 family metallopeptidase [Bacteroidota bacterium]
MHRFSFLALLLLTLGACRNTTEKSSDMHAVDPHSFARPQDAAVTHIDLDLKVDFAAQVLSGKATLQFENKSGTRKLQLDTRDLRIDSVLLDGEQKTTFELMPAQPILGSGLAVDILPETKSVVIHYATSPSAAALQWLQPEQTAGRNHPFLFTQSQAVLARTWIPLQDSPGIRFTYSARIACPPALMAVMSAENDTCLHADGVYTFNMPQPIPSYLMALAVGDLQFHAYDSRCGVYAEPITMPIASNEFVDLPKMISAAEDLYGPYAWGRYDLLVLPPSFPFGGMENPRLTFVTPTILAGDRSLVSLVAHELAHSWSGNLVTNATWNDFWLNEGFTVYFESRIMEKLYGRDYADMLTVLSLGELQKTVAEMGKDHPDTRLYIDLTGRDPDEGVSDIAYEKGRFFLLNIEQAVGRERWDAFLKAYFKSHAFGSITTEMFLADLEKNLVQGDSKLRNTAIRDNLWVYGPGLPTPFPKVQSTALERVASAASAFVGSGAMPDTSGWTTHHWMQFLRNLPSDLGKERMAVLDRAFDFTASGNSEILCQWLELSIRQGYGPAEPALEAFLLRVGRRKFIKPLYPAMCDQPGGREKALSLYTKARPAYHAVSVQTLDAMLGYVAK